MFIYFAGAIRGGREDAGLYQEIISYLKSWGNVLTEHVGDIRLTSAGDDGPNDRYIYQRDMDWLKKSRVVIAEVTQPSLGVGYELGQAISLGKPVLGLYRPRPGKYLSAMISGCPEIDVITYKTLSEAKPAIETFLQKIVGPDSGNGGK